MKQLLLHTSKRSKKGTREGKKGTREGKKGTREGKKGAAPFYFGLAGTLAVYFFMSVGQKSRSQGVKNSWLQ